MLKKLKPSFSVPTVSSNPPHNSNSSSRTFPRYTPRKYATPTVSFVCPPDTSSLASSDATSISSASSTVNPSPSYTPGELGKFASIAARDLQRLGWFPFVRAYQKQCSLNISRFPSLSHPVMPYLLRLAKHGVPAPSQSKPWSLHRILKAWHRGPHISAAKLYAPFVLEDMFNMVREGYWCVLPFSAVQHLPHLKLSPAGVVPQRERRPRIILDYSFPSDANVNADSLPIAPMHAMQFGQAFQCLLQRIVYCNRHYGPPWMAKLDLVDGYYRVPLSPRAALELAVMLPGDGIHKQLIGLPLSLPMGWTNSPPYFCAFTETTTDIANATLHHTLPYTLPTHALEPTLHRPPQVQATAFADSALQPLGQDALPPLATIDVYLDDFMAVAQPPCHTTTMRSLLHAVDSIFYDDPNTTVRRAVISTSKIQKGDASWSTKKTILGWDIDTENMSLTLPDHRKTRLLALLSDTNTKTRISRRNWQQLLGELRSMAMALSGAKFHFSILQNALTHQQGRRLRLTSLIRTALHDWKQLVLQLAHPVALHSLVPRMPDIVMGCDASLLGVGGWLWCPAIPDTTYIISGCPFHPTYSDRS